MDIAVSPKTARRRGVAKEHIRPDLGLRNNEGAGPFLEKPSGRRPFCHGSRLLLAHGSMKHMLARHANPAKIAPSSNVAKVVHHFTFRIIFLLRFTPIYPHRCSAVDQTHVRPRSAGRRPAVSPIGNRRTAPNARRVQVFAEASLSPYRQLRERRSEKVLQSHLLKKIKIDHCKTLQLTATLPKPATSDPRISLSTTPKNPD